MPAPRRIDRARWLGYRWRGHALDARADAVDDLLLLGVQDARSGAARESLLLRVDGIGGVPVGEVVSPEGPLVNWWSVRGAPHVHPLDRMATVRAALAPRDSDADGPDRRAAVAEVASALGAVVTAPIAKGEASRAVSDRVRADLVTRCERCAADHVPDGLFRAAGCQAGIVLGPPDGRTTVLYPPPRYPSARDDDPRRTLLAAYFRVNGPTGRTLFRDWLGADTAELWRDLELVRVAVDGHRYDLPEELVDAVASAPPARGTALVPPGDPYLRQVDRTLLVPDGARRKQVWRAVGAPGALLVDGEVAGTWRYRGSESRLTVTPFEKVSASRRTAALDCARRILDDPERLEVVWDA